MSTLSFSLKNEISVRKIVIFSFVIFIHLGLLWLFGNFIVPHHLTNTPQINAIKVRFVNMKKSSTVVEESAASAQVAPKQQQPPQPKKSVIPVKPVEKIKEQPKIVVSQQSPKSITQQPKIEVVIKKQTTAKPVSAPAASQSSNDDAQGEAEQGSQQTSQGQGTAQGEGKTVGGTAEGQDKNISQAQAAPIADDTPIQVNAVDVISFGKLSYTDKDLQNQSRQVILAINVDAQGKPLHIQIKKSTGLSYLDQLAVKAAQKASFKPYKVNGQGKPIVVDFPINFEMNRRVR